ncbi:PIN domain-containing protein [Planomonospora parontospora]|uniref:PIN domain-containing protein n=1 Tax=Planomonospora parontospora TaxID=58119 RepID=UPI00227D7D76|nr:PIN domain-containing protein [Planomonospora parontospora]
MIDTCVMADIERGVLDPRRLAPYDPAMSVLTLGELLTGLAKAKTKAEREQRTRRISGLVRLVPVLDFSLRTAVAYAMLNAAALSKGREGQRSDMLIAASAMEHGAFLLTKDRGFERLRHISRIRVLHPRDL